MKKFVILSLISFLILAFGATVYGQEKAPALEFKASGFIDAQTEWLRYYSSATTPQTSKIHTATGRVSDKEHAFLDSRAHLRFDMLMGKELSGTFLFEMDSSTWGDKPGANISNLREQGGFGQWNGDKVALEFKNLFIDFGVPLIPVQTTMRIGLQPLSIRPGLLVYTDGMGITAGIKIDPVTIIPLWFKPEEWNTNNSDDVDVYGLHLNAKIGTLTVGGYGLYYNMNTYPLFANSAYTFVGGETINGLTAGTQSAYTWWAGLYADGKVGPLNINFDFIYDDGKVDSKRTAGGDVDYSGWMVNLKVGYPWEKFDFGFQGMYASGPDLNETDKYEGYVVPPGSEAGPIFGESVVFYSSWVNRGNTGIANQITSSTLGRGPTGGTWMAKLWAGFKVTPGWKVTGQVLYIGDTTDHGNTFGNARTATGLRDDDEIGWEFDLYNEFQIYKNLKYTIAAGVMSAGDALDVYEGGSNRGLKTPWAVISRLIYSF